MLMVEGLGSFMLIEEIILKQSDFFSGIGVYWETDVRIG